MTAGILPQFNLRPVYHLAACEVNDRLMVDRYQIRYGQSTRAGIFPAVGGGGQCHDSAIGGYRARNGKLPYGRLSLRLQII